MANLGLPALSLSIGAALGAGGAAIADSDVAVKLRELSEAPAIVSASVSVEGESIGARISRRAAPTADAKEAGFSGIEWTEFAACDAEVFAAIEAHCPALDENGKPGVYRGK